MKKKGQKKSYFLRFALVIVLLGLLVNLGRYQVELIGKKAQLGALQQKAEEKELQITELTNMLENSGDAAFIESAARQRFGYVYANEKVYYDSWGD